MKRRDRRKLALMLLAAGMAASAGVIWLALLGTAGPWS